ncbi:MAG TPA: hypothetical protein VLE27_03295, partial [Thermoanaerobaculia bacterium]|nr:hypothetical protein [Thermoanaerobaculia bacterium]
MIIPVSTWAVTGSLADRHSEDARPIPWQIPEQWHVGRREDISKIQADYAGEDSEVLMRIHRVADERLSLLARKSIESESSAELQARLQILNTRLEELAPQVRDEDIAHLELQAAELEAIREEL